jgi:hypothetical protein
LPQPFARLPTPPPPPPPPPAPPPSATRPLPRAGRLAGAAAAVCSSGNGNLRCLRARRRQPCRSSSSERVRSLPCPFLPFL